MSILERLFHYQSQLMQALGVEISAEDYLDDPQFMASVIGMITESAEVLDAVSTIQKPWKSPDREEARAAFKAEVLDVLFMWVEICIMAGINLSEIESLYLSKYRMNLQRILESPHATEDQKYKAGALLDEATFM